MLKFIFAGAAAVFIFAFILLSAGYEGDLIDKVSFYKTQEEVMEGEGASGGVLSAGDSILVLGCYDIKTDVFFEVLTSSGEIVFLYELPIAPRKNFLPRSFVQIKNLIARPINAINCFDAMGRIKRQFAR